MADPQVNLSAVPDGRSIENMLAIEADPTLNAIWKYPETSDRRVSPLLDRARRRRADLNTDIFNLVGFFSVFQGVLLTAVAQLKSDTYSTCKTIHWPIILTCLAAAVSVAAISPKLSSYLVRDVTIESYRNTLGEITNRRASMLKLGSAYLNEDRREKRRDSIHISQRRSLERSSHMKKILIISAMVLFSGIFIMAYFAILCDCLVIRKWEGGIK